MWCVCVVFVCMLCILCVCACVWSLSVCVACVGVQRRAGLKIELKDVLKFEKVNIF